MASSRSIYATTPMRKNIHKTSEPKARYHVRNWAAYNAGLINQGSVTIWIDEAVLARIPDAIPTRGRPCLYGDALIQALVGVKTVYRLTLRPCKVSPKVYAIWPSRACRCRITPRSFAGQKRLMSNCRSFATTNRSIWLSTAPV
ncbi:MAG: hypothetical protein E5299_01478 [Burkholderia gladioli]|nr:MAG: hypothetical protein E5299_01478 [Burkholderia gladioli]